MSGSPRWARVALTQSISLRYDVPNRLEGYMGQAVKVETPTWDATVLKAKGLVMVDFWAVWCRPCQMIAPIIEELAKEYDGRLTVVKLNTDENPDLASRYQIMGIPTLMFFRDGTAIEKIVGAASKQQFKEKIDTLLAS